MEPTFSVPAKEMSVIYRNSEEFRRRMTKPFLFRMYLLKHVPLAFISGAKLLNLDDNTASISVPFNCINRNPFQSMYLNSLAIGAELAGGILVMMYVLNSRPRIRAIITESNAKYFKKAKDKVYFSCEDGYKVINSIKYVYAVSNLTSVSTYTYCHTKHGEKIAEFSFNWRLTPFSV